MSKTLRRRLENLETAWDGPDWRRYESVPINQWPEWALKAWLGDMTDEQLTAMIAELQEKTDAATSIVALAPSDARAGTNSAVGFHPIPPDRCASEEFK